MGYLSDTHHFFSTRLKRLLIATAVICHFAITLMVMLPNNAPVWKVPVLADLIYLYGYYDFKQTWKMFAPPAPFVTRNEVAWRFEDGWTERAELDKDYIEGSKGKLVIPRGFTRIVTHLRTPALVNPLRPLEPKRDKLVWFYYQQLGSYFCFGDGKIPGLKGMRFYVAVEGITPFYEKDERGTALPKPEEVTSVLPVYERDCA